RRCPPRNARCVSAAVAARASGVPAVGQRVGDGGLHRGRLLLAGGIYPFLPPRVRELVFTKEMWSAAIAGHEFHRNEDTSLGGLKRRLDQAGEEFADLVRDIRNRGARDTAFVDATCDPPE